MNSPSVIIVIDCIIRIFDLLSVSLKFIGSRQNAFMIISKRIKGLLVIMEYRVLLTFLQL